MNTTYYTTITFNGVTRYYEITTYPNGRWDAEGRVDYRCQSREVSKEYWLKARESK